MYIHSVNKNHAAILRGETYICKEKLINRMDNAVVRDRVLIIPKNIKYFLVQQTVGRCRIISLCLAKSAINNIVLRYMPGE